MACSHRNTKPSIDQINDPFTNHMKDKTINNSINIPITSPSSSPAP